MSQNIDESMGHIMNESGGDFQQGGDFQLDLYSCVYMYEVITVKKKGGCLYKPTSGIQ